MKFLLTFLLFKYELSLTSSSLKIFALAGTSRDFRTGRTIEVNVFARAKFLILVR